MAENPVLDEIIQRQREIFNNESVKKGTDTPKIKKRGRKRKIIETEPVETKESVLVETKESVLVETKESVPSLSNLTNNDEMFVCLSNDKNDGTKKNYKCKCCSKVFTTTREEIMEHVQTHKIGPPTKKRKRDFKKEPLICRVCKETFTSKLVYLKHMNHHKNSADILKPLDVDQKMIVKECDKNSRNYMQQLTKKTNEGNILKYYQCTVCTKEDFSKADILKHIRVHTGERPFKCSKCSASFVQITALRSHETRHDSFKKFGCDICGKRFSIKERLKLHIRLHTGEKPHKCKICGQSFARRSNVNQHMRVHVTQKKSFKCEECDSMYASYHTLKTHMNTHKGIKEFQCPACGKKFLRIEGMYKHVRTVHRGNRPYKCNICGKAFKGHLQQHMRLHMGIRPYSCHLCDSSFTQNSQLTVHLRIHTGERPYKCGICASSFAHSSACKIHMRSHTGEKPFTCVICSQAFSQLPHLKKHMKCVHRADKPYMCTLCKDFFQTQEEIEKHKQVAHNIVKTAEQEAQELVEESTLARMRNRLAVLLYRISSEDRRTKFGFGSQLVDKVLKLSLESSGHSPVSDTFLTPLEELRQNVFLLLRWTIPKETMEEYHKNNMTVDEVLDMLTS